MCSCRDRYVDFLAFEEIIHFKDLKISITQNYLLHTTILYTWRLYSGVSHAYRQATARAQRNRINSFKNKKAFCIMWSAESLCSTSGVFITFTLHISSSVSRWFWVNHVWVGRKSGLDSDASLRLGVRVWGGVGGGVSCHTYISWREDCVVPVSTAPCITTLRTLFSSARSSLILPHPLSSYYFFFFQILSWKLSFGNKFSFVEK